MPRTMTQLVEAKARDNPAWHSAHLIVELDAERAVSKLLAEALETVLTDFDSRPAHATAALLKYDEGI